MAGCAIVFRFMDKVIMGSTDIPIDDPDRAECDEQEIDYMLQTLRGVLPGIRVGREHIVYTFCGVRPLPASSSAVTANISRGHTIHTIEPDDRRPFPVICLIGGKLTTFRALAEQNRGSGPLASRDAEDLLDPATADRWRQGLPDRPALARGLDHARRARRTVRLNPAWPRSADRYGAAAEEYLASRPDETPLRALPAYSIGEVERIAREELVVHLADQVYRRSVIGLLGQATPDVLSELADVVGAALGWDEARRDREVELAMPKFAQSTVPVAGVR